MSTHSSAGEKKKTKTKTITGNRRSDPNDVSAADRDRTYFRWAAACTRPDRHSDRCPRRSRKVPRRTRPASPRTRRRLNPKNRQSARSSVITHTAGVRSVRVSYITITVRAGAVQPVALVARTHVAAERVGAVAVFAQVVVFLALVHVLQDHLKP